mmetsp:Transcript_10892/g.28576  ORF Transcript_10892/g.28576 Transcript_10892/m.28576 type:complete len:635 (-) Transcript_10892:846-2750(-)
MARFVLEHLLLANVALSGVTWRRGGSSQICSELAREDYVANSMVTISLFLFALVFALRPYSPAKLLRRGTFAIMLMMVIDCCIGFSYAHVGDAHNEFDGIARRIGGILNMPAPRRAPYSLDEYVATAYAKFDALNESARVRENEWQDIVKERIAQGENAMLDDEDVNRREDILRMRASLNDVAVRLVHLKSAVPAPIPTSTIVLVCTPLHFFFFFSPSIGLLVSLLVVLAGTEPRRPSRRTSVFLYFLLVFLPLGTSRGSIIAGQVVEMLVLFVLNGGKVPNRQEWSEKMGAKAGLVSSTLLLFISIFMLAKYRQEEKLMYRKEEKIGAGQEGQGESERESGKMNEAGAIIPRSYLAVIMWMKEQSGKGAKKGSRRALTGGGSWWSSCVPSSFATMVADAPPVVPLDLAMAMIAVCLYSAGSLHVLQSITEDWRDESTVGFFATIARLAALIAGGMLGKNQGRLLFRPRVLFLTTFAINSLFFIFIVGGIARVEEKSLLGLLLIIFGLISSILCMFVCAFVLVGTVNTIAEVLTPLHWVWAALSVAFALVLSRSNMIDHALSTVDISVDSFRAVDRIEVKGVLEVDKQRMREGMGNRAIFNALAGVTLLTVGSVFFYFSVVLKTKKKSSLPSSQ